MSGNTNPVFTGSPVIGAGTLVTADTGYGGTGGTAPTHTVTIATGTTNGLKVEEVVVVGTATTVAGLVNLFLYDGTTYWFFDLVSIAAQTLSTTSVLARWSKVYANLVVPSGWSLVATTTVAQTGISAIALGGTF
jgi:hypothetical protein